MILYNLKNSNNSVFEIQGQSLDSFSAKYYHMEIANLNCKEKII